MLTLFNGFSGATQAAGGLAGGAGAAAGGGAAAGALSGALGAIGAAVPYVQIAMFAYQAFANAKAKSKARAAERENTAVKLKDVQPSESNTPIDILYGLTATQGHRVFIATRDDCPWPMPMGQLGDFPYDHHGNTGRTPATIIGDAQEFLFTQHILSIGDIEGMLDFTLDKRGYRRRIDDGGLGNHNPLKFGKTTMAGAWNVPYGTADSWATRFATNPQLRTANSRFKDLSYVGIAAQLPRDVDVRIFTGLPEPVFYCGGRYLPGVSGNTRTAILTRTDNLAAVMLDYLTNTLYGPGEPDSRIHWPAWQTFYDLCEKSLVSTGNADSDFSGIDLAQIAMRPREDPRAYVARVAAFLRSLDVVVPADVGYPRVGETPADWLARIRREFTRRGWVRNDQINSGGRLRRHLNADKMRWGAYNGKVNSGMEFLHAVDQMLLSAPGAAMFFTLDSKISISAPDWSQTESEQSDITLTDSHLTAPITTQDIDASGRYNRATVTFNNIDLDFHQDSVVWPQTEAEHAVLLAQDDGQLLEAPEDRAVGIMTKSQALSRARWIVLSSRHAMHTGAYHVKAMPNESVIDPNSTFRIESANSSFSDDVIMGDQRIDLDTGISEFSCTSYNALDNGPVLDTQQVFYVNPQGRTPVGAFIRWRGIPQLPIAAGGQVFMTAVVVGHIRGGTWQKRTSATSPWLALFPAAFLTGTHARGTIESLRYTINDDEECVLQADYIHPGPGTASEPTVELVAVGANRYVAYQNGFTEAVAADDWDWRITPGLAGTGVTVFRPSWLTGTNLQVVDIDGWTRNGVRGQLTVTVTAGTGATRQSATASIVTPWHPLDEERGALTTLDGAMEIP